MIEGDEIRRVLEQVYHDAKISERAIGNIKSLLIHVLERIMNAMGPRLNVLSTRDVQVAVRSVFHQDLAKHAVSEGTKAVARFKAKEKGSGLLFSVDGIRSVMQETSPRLLVNIESAVYMTAVLEYIAAEVLELSASTAQEHGSRVVVPRFIRLAVANDKELRSLFQEQLASLS